ncbi:uncharacterized protein NECHADRAFT_87905 [Fusarium vanettenii 77-13-4]|uniref:Uncharacterized protein n=1 Tax=Fusarium vanettenii (strain ATCC MYA-4622 / CBS 123669 / FGSC 9596 / NRRL 45880 / 77-13-4) TaxID=660122 RepID=C7Z3D0_FUSV7|nr:uncharacterized protein NECHADRAFT_87905 [Fusarium vanettenii 77-13-4]EEU41814.1 predicted protein [Fusarium vanettenii 77-13-4]
MTDSHNSSLPSQKKYPNELPQNCLFIHVAKRVDYNNYRTYACNDFGGAGLAGKSSTAYALILLITIPPVCRYFRAIGRVGQARRTISVQIPCELTLAVEWLCRILYVLMIYFYVILVLHFTYFSHSESLHLRVLRLRASKLRGSSSSDPWEPQFDGWSIGRTLGPVYYQIIAEKWNDSAGPLRKDIIQALSHTDWTVIDILRIGYERSNQRTGLDFDYPFTLLISVGEGSTSWGPSYAVVARYHRTLQRHGVRDIPVEMKEAALVRLSAPRLHSRDVTYPVEINHLFSTNVGVSIARLDQPDREGTKCLYRRDRGTGKILALACRHVTLETAEDHTSRIGGHVLFSPKLSNEVNGTYAVGVERLRDWALIELHADKHHVPLNALTSRVAVAPGAVEAIIAGAGTDGFESQAELWVHSTRNNLQLGGTISKAEMNKPPPEYESKSLDEPAIMVTKYGCTTSLISSATNEAMSITREPIVHAIFGLN